MATSSSPAEATDRVRLSPLPAHSPPSGVDGSGTTTGVTSKASVALNARTSSHMPNGSLSRSVSGPKV